MEFIVCFYRIHPFYFGVENSKELLMIWPNHKQYSESNLLSFTTNVFWETYQISNWLITVAIHPSFHTLDYKNNFIRGILSRNIFCNRFQYFLEIFLNLFLKKPCEIVIDFIYYYKHLDFFTVQNRISYRVNCIILSN